MPQDYSILHTKIEHGSAVDISALVQEMLIADSPDTHSQGGGREEEEDCGYRGVGQELSDPFTSTSTFSVLVFTTG